MGPLHRAGLGGLAATLRWIEENVASDHHPPGEWRVDDRSIRLSWRSPELAGTFLRRLYELAFQVDADGLIHLEGAYGGVHPPFDVKAALQQGLSLTILQFGPNRKADGPPLTRTYEIDGKPMPPVRAQRLKSYTHMSAWSDLVSPSGTLKGQVSISGTIAPGFVQRHVVHQATTIEQPPGLALALHFALIGTLALPIDRKSGALLIPATENLKQFARRRGLLTPRTVRACQIANPADAALQALLRLRKDEVRDALSLRRCLAVLFATKSWNEKQKSRALVLDLEPSPDALDRFEVAMQELPARVATPRAGGKKGGAPEPFWANSVVRPLVAENLALNRPWFEDFRRLVVGPDGRASDEKLRHLDFEKKGLQSMIDQPWSDQGEQTLVRVVHQAMNQQFGRIWEECNKNETTFRNRRERQMQRWRLGFANAKSADDVRNALTDLWSRAGQVPLLMESWQGLLPVLCDENRWKLNRDLALLALASYKNPSRNRSDAGVVAANEPVDDDV